MMATSPEYPGLDSLPSLVAFPGSILYRSRPTSSSSIPPSPPPSPFLTKKKENASINPPLAPRSGQQCGRRTRGTAAGGHGAARDADADGQHVHQQLERDVGAGAGPVPAGLAVGHHGAARAGADGRLSPPGGPEPQDRAGQGGLGRAQLDQLQERAVERHVGERDRRGLLSLYVFCRFFDRAPGAYLFLFLLLYYCKAWTDSKIAWRPRRPAPGGEQGYVRRHAVPPQDGR